MPDDFTNSYATTRGRIALGHSAQGVLEVENDIDAFHLNFPQIGFFRVAVAGAEIRAFESRGAVFLNTDPAYSPDPGFRDVLLVEPGNAGFRIGNATAGNTEGGYTLNFTTLAAQIGGSGNDWFTVAPQAPVRAQGAGGRDMLSFVNFEHGVAIGRNGFAPYEAGDYTYGTLSDAETSFHGFGGFTGTVHNDFFMPEVALSDSLEDRDAPLRLRGLSGDDIFGVTQAPTIYDGGIGRDKVTYFTPISAFADDRDNIHVSLLRGRGWGDLAQGDTYISIENVTGSWGSDVLTGDREDNVLSGATGVDTLIGNAGNDTIEGGSGPWYNRRQDDVAVYNYDRDLYDITPTYGGWQIAYNGPGAGDGVDQISGIEVLRFADEELRVTTFYSGFGAPRLFVGGRSLVTATVDYHDEVYQTYDDLSASLLAGVGWTGEAAGDSFDQISNLGGGLGNDLLIGDHLDNYLDGYVGNDTLVGNGGNDTLHGTEGYDVAVFSYDRDRYFIGTYDSNVLVHDLGAAAGGGDGFDTLYDIDVLRFADGDFIL